MFTKNEILNTVSKIAYRVSDSADPIREGLIGVPNKPGHYNHKDWPNRIFFADDLGHSHVYENVPPIWKDDPPDDKGCEIASFLAIAKDFRSFSPTITVLVEEDEYAGGNDYFLIASTIAGVLKLKVLESDINLLIDVGLKVEYPTETGWMFAKSALDLPIGESFAALG